MRRGRSNCYSLLRLRFRCLFCSGMLCSCHDLVIYGSNLSMVQSSGVCLSGRRFRSVIVAERGYWGPMVQKARLSSFVFSGASKICSRSKHKFANDLLEEVAKYSTGKITDESKLLSKVSALMGFDGIPDFVGNRRPESESNKQLKDDAVLACKRFPSISLGSSPPVELYDDNTSFLEHRNLLNSERNNGLLPCSVHAGWINPSDLSEPLSSFSLEVQNVESSSVVREESSNSSPVASQTLAFETNEKSDDSMYEISFLMEPELQQDDVSRELYLDESLSCIGGLSKRSCNQLESCGFHTMRKLLHHFPRTYADLQNAQVDIADGQYLIFIGKILSSRGIRAGCSFSFLEVIVSCEIAGREGAPGDNTGVVNKNGNRTIYLHLKKYFRGTRFTYQPFLKSLEGKHKIGDFVCVSGKVKTMQAEHHYEMREYNIDVLKDENESSLHTKGRPYPIYPSKGGLSPTFLRDIIARALQVLPLNIDPIPKEITKDFGLPFLRDAYNSIHQPRNLDEADLARKRLIFDEFFYLQLGRLYQMLEGLGTKVEKDGLLNKHKKPVLNAVYMEEWSSLTKSLLTVLPYSLTSSQLSAVSEIVWDLKRPVPMNRLLQGDVGCGKTVVAFLACMEVISSGYQAAFMVPTELLAIQHYDQLRNLLEDMKDVQSKPSIALLTGSTPAKQSRMIRQDLQTGAISMVIGTHSLIAEKVEFSALRISVVDEQHRFGVIQRGRFNNKLFSTSLSSKTASADTESTKEDNNMAPHVLAMSATPIPRSLALALYGDTSLTQITGLPPGRIPVETYIFEGNENGFEKVYSMMLDELESGGKVYLVYPIIEQSEQLPQLRAASADLQTISNKFPNHSCGLLHGRMKGEDKEEALKKFRSGDTQILLATQVIEIGVDVPDASMMVVMNAERFGIAQLHQLRGRVGRGTRKSKCLLVGSSSNSLNRLKVLEKSSDGFYLANIDLLLRGPGDLLGKKQSGHLPEFPIARLEIDGNLLQEAHVAALRVLSDSHDLEKFPALKAELSMRQPLCLLGD